MNLLILGLAGWGRLQVHVLLALQEQKETLTHDPSMGRTLTGDGATKKVPLINFNVHVPGKGIALAAVIDCTEHMAEGGTKDGL